MNETISIVCRDLEQRRRVIMILSDFGLRHSQPMDMETEQAILHGTAYLHSYTVIVKAHGWCVSPKPFLAEEKKFVLDIREPISEESIVANMSATR